MNSQTKTSQKAEKENWSQEWKPLDWIKARGNTHHSPGPRSLTAHPHHSSCRPRQSHPRSSWPEPPCHQSTGAHTRCRHPQTWSWSPCNTEKFPWGLVGDLDDLHSEVLRICVCEVEMFWHFWLYLQKCLRNEFICLTYDCDEGFSQVIS